MSTDTDVVGNTFDRHKIRRETGWTWSCRRPGDSAYAFRVTWCPFNLVVTGDVGEIVITHYSFDDPWSAAAWVNGAGFDYFMGKSNIDKQYDREATAEFIVEDAYRQLRDEPDNLALFERMIDYCHGVYGEASETETRKEACRELMSEGVSADDAYAITSDPEMLLMRYPVRSQWHYRAMKLWSAWMWENEPAWHVVKRNLRRVRGEWRDIKRFPVLYSPVLYVRRDEKGRPVHFNGSRHWRWVKKPTGAAYRSVHPLHLFGYDLSRFGFWQEGGSNWPDRIEDYLTGWQSKDQFEDVRPEWRSTVVA